MQQEENVIGHQSDLIYRQLLFEHKNLTYCTKILRQIKSMIERWNNYFGIEVQVAWGMSRKHLVSLHYHQSLIKISQPMIWNETTKMLRKWNRLLLPNLLHNVAHKIAPPLHYQIHHTAWAEACNRLSLYGQKPLQCQIASGCASNFNHHSNRSNTCGFHW
jgi:hypothetical protein